MEEIKIPDTTTVEPAEQDITEEEYFARRAAEAQVQESDSFTQAGNLLDDPGKTVQNEHVFDLLFNAYRAALSTVIEVLPESRAKSLAKTALEESHMWAQKAVKP